MGVALSLALATALLDVPFVPQSEALCGGAAVSMVMRYWSPVASANADSSAAALAKAEDFASLVDKSAGGISVGTLTRAVRQRGWTAHAFSATAADFQSHLARGQPVIALVQVRPGRLHYVVVVAWTGDRVVFHDPADKPFVVRDARAFERAWQATGRTALLLLPPVASTAPAGAPASGSKSDAVRDRAGALFLDKRYADAASLAEIAVAGDPDDLASWQLLAAARYLQGDADRALDAWNRRGEPRVDLARVEGLSRTRYDVVFDLLDVPPRSVLTRDALARAARRVAAMPSAQLSRVRYSPRESGSTTIDVAIVERPMLPTSRAELVASGIHAATMREARVNVASPTGNGELWTAAVRWWSGRPRVGIALALPAVAARTGLWSIEGAWERQTYALDGTALASEHRRAAVSFADWWSSRTRYRLGAAIDRWDDGAASVSVLAGLERRLARDHVSVRVASSASARFTTGEIGARARSSHDPLSGWHAMAGVAAVSRGTPLDLWPGGDTGVARPILLRAHPLLEDGAIRVAALRRTLPHASLEYRRRVWSLPLLEGGWSAFADTAGHHFDVGLGMRFRLPATHALLQVDLARGVRDGATALSLSWHPVW